MLIKPKVKPGWILVTRESDEWYGIVQYRNEDGEMGGKYSVSKFLGSHDDHRYRFVGTWRLVGEIIK